MQERTVGAVLIVLGGVTLLCLVTGTMSPSPAYVLLGSHELEDIRGGHTCYGAIQGGRCGAHPSTCDAGMQAPCEEVEVEGEEEEDPVTEWHCKNGGATKYEEGSGKDYWPTVVEIGSDETGSGKTGKSAKKEFICHRLVTCATECDTDGGAYECVGEDAKDSDDQHTIRTPEGDDCEHPHEDL